MDSVYALVISPHPDDAEFGAAGTVARWTRESRRAAYLICTDGGKGTGDRDIRPEDLVRTREAEQRAAARVLGVQEIEFLGRPDQGLEDEDGFRRDLVRAIRKYRPEVVLTTDPYRRYIWHRDHRITGQVVLDAVFPYARDHLAYPDLLAEGFEPHKVREMLFWGTDDINFRVDITDTFEQKLAALRCHKSQVVGHESREWGEWLRQRNRTMAEGEPYELAEAFHRVEIIY
ncbi:MAG: PIG-L deacetylase family protein [Pseudomonadota bacterium]